MKFYEERKNMLEGFQDPFSIEAVLSSELSIKNWMPTA